MPRELREAICARFLRITGATVVVVSVDGEDGVGDVGDTAAWHPECVPPPGRTCRKRGLMADARQSRKPLGRWQRCARGKLCGVVPVVQAGRCVAVCQVVSPEGTGEDEFQRRLELLEVLAENCALRLARDGKRRVAGPTGCQDEGAKPAQAMHPQVQRAMRVIETRLTQPDLTVAGIAAEVAMNSSYLAHIFAQQVGVRMSGYIEARRMEQAMHLLAATDWQVKQVARATGHGNADWFSYAFRRHAGMTPGEYRRRARADPP